MLRHRPPTLPTRREGAALLQVGADFGALLGRPVRDPPVNPHPPVNPANLNYMLNLDMIGRLGDTLIIGGYGSSPAWWGICREVKDQKGLFLDLDSSGVRPGDQAPFYKKGIPVLCFSTGPYPEYHLPGDSPDKINYPGELQVLKFIYDIVEGADKRGRLAFTGTRS